MREVLGARGGSVTRGEVMYHIIRCFHDCPIMELSSTFISFSSSTEGCLLMSEGEVIPNSAKLYFM